MPLFLLFVVCKYMHALYLISLLHINFFIVFWLLAVLSFETEIMCYVLCDFHQLISSTLIIIKSFNINSI